MRPLARPDVLPVGLIEAAVPPTTQQRPDSNVSKSNVASGGETAPAPPARVTLRQAPKPTTIEAVPTAPAAKPPIMLRPVAPGTAQPPATPGAAQGSPFKFRDGASALANPQLPDPADDRTTMPRSVLVAPSIAPAVRPTVPTTMPLVVPAPKPTPARSPQVADPSKQNELKIALPEPKPAAMEAEPKSVVAEPTPAPLEVATETPQEVPAEKEPTAHKWVKKKRTVAHPPIASKNEPTPAKVPAAEPTPAVVPTPSAESVAEKLEPKKAAPVPVELAPTPAPVAAEPAKLADDKAAADEHQREPALADGEGGAPAMPLADSHEGQSPREDEYTKLPWADSTRRSPELIAEMKRADERVLHGYDLASRGAVYAARAEFIAALKIIAQAHDNQDGTRRYSRAAAAGLVALKEARDFVRTSSTLREVEISSVLVAHSTPVLKDGDTSDMPPIAAARLYYTYAQEQLSAAVGQEICGSMALYAMGKVAVMSAKQSGATAADSGQAMALYRAALIAYPKNFRAANELGVLLAEHGQYELARDLLIRSVVVSPQATTWKNLAAIHGRIGEHQLAERQTACVGHAAARTRPVDNARGAMG